MYNALELIDDIIAKLIHSTLFVKLNDLSIITYNAAANKTYSSIFKGELLSNIPEINLNLINDFIASNKDTEDYNNYTVTKYYFNDSEYLLIENKGEINLSDVIQSDILLNSSSDLIIISDDNGIINFISDNCDLFIGYFKDELINKCFYDLLAPGELERLDKYAEDIINYAKPTSIELKFFIKTVKLFI